MAIHFHFLQFWSVMIFNFLVWFKCFPSSGIRPRYSFSFRRFWRSRRTSTSAGRVQGLRRLLRAYDTTAFEPSWRKSGPGFGRRVGWPENEGEVSKNILTDTMRCVSRYDLPSICDAAQECVRALLGDEPTPLSEEEVTRPPCQAAIDTMQKTIALQLSHWPCLDKLAHTVVLPYGGKEKDDSSDTVTRMAGLSMQQNKYLQ